MKKHTPNSNEDPQLYPPDPCADTDQAHEENLNNAVEGGPIYRADIPRNLPLNIPLR